MGVEVLLKSFCNWNSTTNLSFFFELVLCCQFFLKLPSDSKISSEDRHTHSEYDQESLVPLGDWTKMT